MEFSLNFVWPDVWFQYFVCHHQHWVFQNLAIASVTAFVGALPYVHAVINDMPPPNRWMPSFALQSGHWPLPDLRVLFPWVATPRKGRPIGWLKSHAWVQVQHYGCNTIGESNALGIQPFDIVHFNLFEGGEALRIQLFEDVPDISHIGEGFENRLRTWSGTRCYC
jgi:hypothetical protein